jgi:hypothetical protein
MTELGQQKILDISRTISEQVGRGGVLDSREKAVQKLFTGDPAKKAGDMPESAEIFEELGRDTLDLPGLASEIADWAYYGAKIPDMPEELETEFLGACGFTKEGAEQAAIIKYSARMQLNIMAAGKTKAERHAVENEQLSQWLNDAQENGLVDTAMINREKAQEVLGQIKNVLGV